MTRRSSRWLATSSSENPREYHAGTEPPQQTLTSARRGPSCAVQNLTDLRSPPSSAGHHALVPRADFYTTAHLRRTRVSSSRSRLLCAGRTDGEDPAMRGQDPRGVAQAGEPSSRAVPPAVGQRVSRVPPRWRRRGHQPGGVPRSPADSPRPPGLIAIRSVRALALVTGATHPRVGGPRARCPGQPRLNAPSFSSCISALTPALSVGPPPGTAAAWMASSSSRFVAP